MLANRVTRLPEVPTLIISVLIVVMLLISGYYVYSQQPPNQAPVFSEGPVTEREIAENIRPQTNVGVPVSASDPDNDSITYQLTGEDAALEFYINESSGQIQTLRYLDYEKTNMYLLTVVASDGQLTTEIDVVVFVIKRPEFKVKSLSDPPYIFEHYDGNPSLGQFYTIIAGMEILHTYWRSLGLERVAVGENVGKPIDTSVIDNPDNIPITFRLSDKIHNEYFNIDETSGQLSIKKKIDYDADEFRNRRSRMGNIALPIRIIMYDEHGISDAVSHCVIVRGIDEPPIIQRPNPYIIEINENEVFSNSDPRRVITAMDQEGDSFDWEIEPSGDWHIGIHANSGELFMKGGGTNYFDYETQQVHEYIIRARQSSRGSNDFDEIVVRFEVQDVSD